MTDSITISTGSRLHFGLYAFGKARPRQFGGVGAMVDVPVTVRIGPPTTEPEIDGWHRAAAEQFVETWFANREGEASGHAGELGSKSVRVEVLEAPPHHTGMGLGTQLGLAISLGLFQWLEGRSPGLLECASAVGRGLRSAVGTYGFFYGGVIVDQGKLPGEGVSPLQCRLAFPGEWRWVLMRLPSEAGLSGAMERAAFERLTPMTTAQTEQLRRQITAQLLPALKAEDFERFSEVLYDYGRSAGECFAEIQGGPYRNRALADLVHVVRELGVAGVGQSSWGPTLFALTPDQHAAEQLVGELQESLSSPADLWWQIVKPRNEGFTVMSKRTATKEGSCRNSVSISTT